MLSLFLRRLVWIVSIHAITFVFFGCASQPGQPNYFSEPNLPISDRIDKAAENTTAASLGQDILVYGRLRWLDNDEERTEYRSTWGWNVWFPYFRTQDAQSGRFFVEEDGSFTWRIPKGSYLFYRIDFRDAWDGMHYVEPKVSFEATNSAQAICLGTLVINLKSRRDLIGKLWINGLQIRVDDECDALSTQFHAKYTDPSIVDAKSLMRFDPNMAIPAELQRRNQIGDLFRILTPGLMTIP